MARIYSGFTVVGTRALGHRHRECGNKESSSSLSSAPILSWLVGPSLLLLNTSSAVVLCQEVRELLQIKCFKPSPLKITFKQDGMLYLVGRLGEDSLLPEVRGEVTVGLGNGSIGCLGCYKVVRNEKTRYPSYPLLYDFRCQWW